MHARMAGERRGGGVTKEELRRVFWSGEDDGRVGRAMLAGAVGWGVYSFLQIVANGVVLDESVVPGQIIANAVRYPPGHPHDIFYRSAYSLSHFVAAAVWTVVPDAVVISAVRNWLFLVTSLMAPFSVALVLTRRPSWAHAAVALTALGAYLPFAGVYPMWVFPYYYSNGHIGLQLAVITGALLVGRMWRTGGLLLGAMPAIHATLTLAVWPWAGCYFLGTRALKDPETRERFVPAFTLGLAVSVGLALIIVLLPDATAAVAPYDRGLDGAAVREQFIALTDVHRRQLPLFSFAYFVNSAAFVALGVLLIGLTSNPTGSEASRARDAMWMCFVGAGTWCIVFGAWAFLQLFGALPNWVVTAMPGRFSNVSAVLLIPMTVAALAAVFSAENGPSQVVGRLLFAGLILGAGLLASPLVPFIDRRLVSRYLLFGAWGIVFGSAFWMALRVIATRRSVLVSFLLLLGTSLLFVAGTRVALYLLGIVAVTYVASWALNRTRINAGGLTVASGRLLVVGVIVAVIVMMPGRTGDMLATGRLRWDMVSEYDRQLGQWLKESASPDDLVLPAFYPRMELQAKTGQPVLLEIETLWFMTYMPKLAGLVGMMVLDLYGVDYSDRAELLRECPRGQVNPWCEVWNRRWEERSRSEWVALGEKYNFRYVLGPSELGLDLAVALLGEHWTLYDIDEMNELPLDGADGDADAPTPAGLD